MAGEETPLAGGRLTRVVRVGATVRRPTGPWTPTVAALLGHLAAEGFDQAPRHLGYDDQRRQVLTYLRGDTVGTALPWPEWTRDGSLLAEVGRATAALHRASAGFRPAGVVDWHEGPASLGPGEIVCHHDLAPYNTVVAAGRLVGFIDWDLAGPGTARSELAFVAWQWVPFHDPVVAAMFGWAEPVDRAGRLRTLLDAYGLADRSGFMADVAARIRRNRGIIVARAAAGEEAYVRLREEGHVIGMDRALSWLEDDGHGADIQRRIS